MQKKLSKLINRKVLKNKIEQTKQISSSNTNPKQDKNNNTIEIERKNILTKNNDDGKIGKHKQYEIQGM